MATEIELKFTLSPQYVDKLTSLPLLASYLLSEPTSQKLHTVYYDTPDLILQSMRVALRLRKVGEEWIQTIKSGSHIAAGLHQHEEWEQPISSAQPDFSKITEPNLIKLFSDNLLRKQLHPIFVTNFNRTTFYLGFQQDCTIELCLDQGNILSGERSIPICEVELELKSGTSNQLLAFAELLKQSCSFPLKQENINKAMRGYALFAETANTKKP